ncbi:rRNA maturation RNase YbeY [Paenibacillus sp. GD4]|jgi:probable rRNA maturation factor|uniref:rRNA maturation RNase YbeY n=1 Tax=Paenibacillus sp. GD4 TaxID=3068890 RepID=UPI0027967FAC|nr:rRNA maturation RNase YbeY [Paenibacillus sp. GD4]MDQ1912937.1 rRNA maturation RNase YbeY [Paenibacillus sp. GD4]
MALELAWNNEYEAFEITPDLVEKLEELLRLAGESEQITEGEVALTFVSNETIQELNKHYRGLDKPTDVLSFAMQEMGEDEMEIIYDEDGVVDAEELEEGSRLDGEAGEIRQALAEEGVPAEGADFEEPLGDIIISIPRAIEQAEEYGHSVERELGFLFVHGFLHLIGYDHQDAEAEKEMFGKQEAILLKAGLTR